MVLAMVDVDDDSDGDDFVGVVVVAEVSDEMIGTHPTTHVVALHLNHCCSNESLDLFVEARHQYRY